MQYILRLHAFVSAFPSASSVFLYPTRPPPAQIHFLSSTALRLVPRSCTRTLSLAQNFHINRIFFTSPVAALETLTYLCLFFFIFFCFPPNASCRRLNSSSVEEHPRAASSGARTRAKTRKKNGRTSGGDGDAMAGGVEGAGKVESVKNI